MVDLIPAAFCGGVQQSLPHFVGEQGVCLQLQNLISGNSAQLPPAGSMWEPLIASGSRTGLELGAAWNELRRTGREACTFLERDLEGPLKYPVGGMGNGGEDGSVRRQVVEQLQGLLKAVLQKFLKNYPEQSARPVLHFPQLDKVSSAWLSALPGPSTHIPSPAFSEAFCAYICVPSPACRDLIGQPIGRGFVDIWGDKVQSATLPGDHFRLKHDTNKMKIFSLANECRLPVTCEVFGCFAPCIPQEGLSRLERGRQRQSIIPDFKFELPNALGRVSTLAELKTIAFCQSYHFPGARKRGVEARADDLPADYLRKARETDRNYCGTPQGEQGPVERKLLSFPPLLKLVVGPFGECSQDLHELLETMAEMKTQFQSRSRGEMESEWKIASNLSYLRRQLSVCAVRAVADSLLALVLVAERSRRAQAMASEEIGRRSGPTLAHQYSDHCSSTSGHTMAAVDQSGTAFIQ